MIKSDLLSAYIKGAVFLKQMRVEIDESHFREIKYTNFWLVMHSMNNVTMLLQCIAAICYYHILRVYL